MTTSTTRKVSTGTCKKTKARPASGSCLIRKGQNQMILTIPPKPRPVTTKTKVIKMMAMMRKVWIGRGTGSWIKGRKRLRFDLNGLRWVFSCPFLLLPLVVQFLSGSRCHMLVLQNVVKGQRYMI